MLLVGIMCWLGYWSLPTPGPEIPGAVMTAWMVTDFAAAAGATRLLGPWLVVPGIVVIALAAFIGVAAANNGQPDAALFLLLTQFLLAAGVILLRTSFRAAFPAVTAPVA